tara:strand:+ start:819 stop:1220 length:402 start_codon:yes stop_codon:yes gene_type:complete
MAYKQNPTRGQSDSYASMISKGLINEPEKKRTHVEKDGVIHEVIGDSHIKSPSGKIIKVAPNEWKGLYKQSDYTSKRTLEDVPAKTGIDIATAKEMKRNVVAGKGKEQKGVTEEFRDELARNRVPTGNEITGK